MSYNDSYGYFLCTDNNHSKLSEFIEDARKARDEEVNTLVFWSRGKVKATDKAGISYILSSANSRIRNKLGINDWHVSRINNLVVIADEITPKGLEMLHEFTNAYQIGLIILSDN